MKNKVVKNASWIIVCRIAQSALTLLVGMLTARYLGPSNYGLINYATSLVAFFVPVMYLGLNSILTQEFVTHKERTGVVLGTSITMSLISAVLCMIGSVSFVMIANRNETDTIIVCLLYSTILIFQAVDLIQYWFQSKLMSKYTSIVMLIAYALVSVYKIWLLITQKSIYWFAVSNALDYLIIAAALLVIYKRLKGPKMSVSFSEGKRLLSRSKFYIITNLMVVVFSQTDRLMLKLMLSDEATGYYSAAVTSAAITSFIYSAIVDSARPSIYANAESNYEEFEKGMTRLYSVVIYMSLIQSLIMTIASDLIIQILYGSEYMPASAVLRLVVWYTTFSYTGLVRGVWLLAEEKQKYLVVINLLGALANVALNFMLIPYIGTMGAALASLITQIFSNFILGFIIKPIRRSNTLMIRALNPMVIIDTVKSLKKG